jgi:hypothetical protein
LIQDTTITEVGSIGSENPVQSEVWEEQSHRTLELGFEAVKDEAVIFGSSGFIPIKSGRSHTIKLGGVGFVVRHVLLHYSGLTQERADGSSLLFEGPSGKRNTFESFSTVWRHSIFTLFDVIPKKMLLGLTEMCFLHLQIDIFLTRMDKKLLQLGVSILMRVRSDKKIVVENKHPLLVVILVKVIIYF